MTVRFEVQARRQIRHNGTVVSDETRRASTTALDDARRTARRLAAEGFTVWIFRVERGDGTRPHYRSVQTLPRAGPLPPPRPLLPPHPGATGHAPATAPAPPAAPQHDGRGMTTARSRTATPLAVAPAPVGPARLPRRPGPPVTPRTRAQRAIR